MIQPLWKTAWQFLIKLHVLAIRPSYLTPDYLCKKDKSTCLQKDLNMNDHGSFTHSSPKLETTQLSISRLMNIQTMGHAYSGKLLSNKKEQTIDRYKNFCILKCIVLCEKKPSMREDTQYDSISLKFKNRQN